MPRRKQFSRDVKMAMWRAQDYLCPLCSLVLPPSGLMDVDLVNVDHRRPWSHGGPDSRENLQLVHVACNQDKADSCPGCEVCDPA
jgi:5-methylcytosine-specific restriction endonuclease McrA